MTKLLFTFSLLLVLRGAVASGPPAPVPAPTPAHTVPAHAAPPHATPAPAVPAAGPSQQITLPDPGTYSYWIQGMDGTILDPPVTVSEKQTVTLESEVTTGDHVFVLSARTGLIVSRVVTMGLDGNLVPLTFSPAEFQPAPPVAAPPASPPETGTGISRFLTGLISIILALGVLWLLVHLIQTRGQPLLTLARRAGVDAPDPAPLAAEDAEETVVYTPTKRPLEQVPEEAGLLVSTAVERGPEIALTGSALQPGKAALIGLQGLAAGVTFSLAAGNTVIGRDGENGIVLAENTVSRRHARLSREADGRYVLTDLGSANGVYVNGMRVQRAVLNSNDEIKIGDNYFRFQAEESVSHP